MMRTHFFRLIQSNEVASDLPFYLQMLNALTDNGREIQNFEEEIGLFMLNWMDRVIEGKPSILLLRGVCHQCVSPQVN
jgi:tuberous sclerosis 2